MHLEFGGIRYSLASIDVTDRWRGIQWSTKNPILLLI